MATVNLVSVKSDGKQKLIAVDVESLGGATDIMITNYSITSINTEFLHSLQNNLKQLIIRNRDKGLLKISFVAGETGSKYLTIPGGASLALGDLLFNSKILYMQSDKISTIEIVELYS